jgi:hypothetical protein
MQPQSADTKVCGAGFLDRIDLVAGHRRRDRRVFEREGAAETATFGFVSVHGDFDSRQLLSSARACRCVPISRRAAHEVCRRDARRRRLVGQPDLRDLQQEFGEFENSLGQRPGLRTADAHRRRKSLDSGGASCRRRNRKERSPATVRERGATAHSATARVCSGKPLLCAGCPQQV